MSLERVVNNHFGLWRTREPAVLAVLIAKRDIEIVDTVEHARNRGAVRGRNSHHHLLRASAAPPKRGFREQELLLHIHRVILRPHALKVPRGRVALVAFALAIEVRLTRFGVASENVLSVK